jgi:hypothetical protein
LICGQTRCGRLPGHGCTSSACSPHFISFGRSGMTWGWSTSSRWALRVNTNETLIPTQFRVGGRDRTERSVRPMGLRFRPYQVARSRLTRHSTSGSVSSTPGFPGLFSLFGLLGGHVPPVVYGPRPRGDWVVQRVIFQPADYGALAARRFGDEPAYDAPVAGPSGIPIGSPTVTCAMPGTAQGKYVADNFGAKRGR